MITIAVINDIFLIIVVVTAFFYLRKQLFRGNFAHNIIKLMFNVVLTLLVFDAVIHLVSDYPSLSLIYNIFTVMSAILIPSIGYMWLIYIRSLTNMKVSILPLTIITSSLLVLNIILSIFSVLPGYALYYDFSSTIVKTGPSFYIFGIISILPFILATVILVLKWSSLKKKRRPFVFLGVSLFPILGFIGQSLNVDFTVTLASVVVTFIIIVLDIQHQFVVTDYLTGLYNRRRLSQKLSEKILKMKEGKMFGGYMIDINNFKYINDEYGHTYGDRIIQDVATILLTIANPNDIVSRFGGDEFVIIRDLKSKEELREFKHKIIDAVNEHNRISDNEIAIQLGIGADIYTKKADYTAERFLEIIDELMYLNKKMIKDQTEDEKSTLQ